MRSATATASQPKTRKPPLPLLDHHLRNPVLSLQAPQPHLLRHSLFISPDPTMSLFRAGLSRAVPSSSHLALRAAAPSVPRRTITSFESSPSGPSFGLSEDQEAYLGEWRSPYRAVVAGSPLSLPFRDVV